MCVRCAERSWKVSVLCIVSRVRQNGIISVPAEDIMKGLVKYD